MKAWRAGRFTESAQPDLLRGGQNATSGPTHIRSKFTIQNEIAWARTLRKVFFSAGRLRSLLQKTVVAAIPGAGVALQLLSSAVRFRITLLFYGANSESDEYLGEATRSSRTGCTESRRARLVEATQKARGPKHGGLC